MTDVSSLQSINDSIKEMQEQMRAIEKKAREEGETLFAKEIQPLFDKYDFLGSISWTQYTPWFNDGDECVFGSHHEDAAINSVTDIENDTNSEGWENGEDWHNQIGECIKVDNPNYDPEEAQKPWRERNRLTAKQTLWRYEGPYGEADNEIRSFLLQFEDNMMKALFGDHAQVTVKRDDDGQVKVEVDEYQHD